MSSLIAAVRQVGRTGDDAQRQAARAVLDNAVRAVWSILAQGPDTPSDVAAPAAGGQAETVSDTSASRPAEDGPSPREGGDAAPAAEA